jgi:hypothetical protein
MKKPAKTADPQSVFCEVCLKRVPRSEALINEARDYVAYFCSDTCYGRWRGPQSPQVAAPDIQEGQGRSRSRDDRVKRVVKQHPQRDEPRADSVERDDTPS